MKVAVLSDIHANLAALERVFEDISLWRPDAVVVNGDTVNRGPRPLACWQFVQAQAEQSGWHLLRGNHEDYLLQFEGKDGAKLATDERQQHAFWTYWQLNGSMKRIRPLPSAHTLYAPDGSDCLITHASVHSNRDGIEATASDAEIRAQIGTAVSDDMPVSPPPAVFCTGHTHKPFVRKVDDTLVVNSGAVGFPFDRDWRASYAQLSWRKEGWSGKIKRLTYDRERAERDFETSGFLAEGGPMAALMLQELRQSRGCMQRWNRQYGQAVKQGHLSLAESVTAYLGTYAPTLTKSYPYLWML